MYKDCQICNTSKLEYSLTEEKKENLIKYNQWQSKKEDRTIKEKQVQVRITAKIELILQIPKLIQLFEENLPEFKRHMYNVYHQQVAVNELKNKMAANEILIIIDFSENYVLKYCGEEVQAVHFGASQKQLSLHTGVYYIKPEGSLKPLPNSFCTVSNNLDHGSHAIWSHLTPILEDIHQKFPLIDTFHFQSDGPTSQYKNKFNMYFLMSYLPKIVKNIKLMSWNFSIAGHGKGPADGVGGTLKRTADALVSQGNDIISATQFVEKLNISCKKIQLLEILDEQISGFKSLIPKNVSAIKKITSLHQLTWTSNNPTELNVRALSCFICDLNAFCSHYGKSNVQLLRILFKLINNLVNFLI